MGTQVLPQALHMIPRNPTQFPCHVKKLGFPTFLFRAPSPFITTRVSISVLHLNSPFGSIFSSFGRRDFVVRVESSPEGEVEDNGANGEGAEAKAEVGEEAEAEAGLEGEVENEERAMEPRKAPH